jgi:transcriptional regulator
MANNTLVAWADTPSRITADSLHTTIQDLYRTDSSTLVFQLFDPLFLGVMYLRPIHAESHIPTLRQLIHENPLGILITAYDPSFLSQPITTTSNSTTSTSRIHTTHLPWVLSLEDETSETELGTLKAHIARQNPQSKILLDLASTSPSSLDQEEVCVIFTSPADHYISPSFYVDSKPRDGKVVPTWNYASVAAYGHLKIHSDKSDHTSNYLDDQLNSLTDQSEKQSGPHTGANSSSHWKVSDAPKTYTTQLKRAIIGIELKITRLEGKWKMSQESSEKDRKGVVDGLRGLEGARASEVADAVVDRSKGKTM